MPRADSGPTAGPAAGEPVEPQQPPAKGRATSHRRPPEKTAGTFPPEGSAAAAGRGQPVPVRQWPIVLVLTLVAVGLAVTALDDFRPGVVTIGVALLVGSLLRAVLPEVGMLAVRSRFTDIVVMGVLGAAIVLLALASEPGAVITLPWATDIARFFGRDQG
ncbi:DUF3017 domain-containing protein [Streptacidiphilus cavernicola]|uniref:DUF3017 domain-containing protein n=1 Tax=Streptacidiphilus cavernicola TaxID=3342716 RepID=A0ABV6VU69_9ACTN